MGHQSLSTEKNVKAKKSSVAVEYLFSELQCFQAALSNMTWKQSCCYWSVRFIKCQHTPRPFSSFNRKQCVKLALSAGSDPEVCFTNNKVLFEGQPAQHNFHLSIPWSLLSCHCAITFVRNEIVMISNVISPYRQTKLTLSGMVDASSWWNNLPITARKTCN